MARPRRTTLRREEDALALTHEFLSMMLATRCSGVTLQNLDGNRSMKATRAETVRDWFEGAFEVADERGRTALVLPCAEIDEER
jgi:hypothetical protein